MLNMVLVKIAIILIRVYQLTFSFFIGGSCRYFPTCSAYVEQAMRRHGFWPGGWMGLSRITRCRPGGGHGLDLVPDATPPKSGWLTPWRYGSWRSRDRS